MESEAKTEVFHVRIDSTTQRALFALADLNDRTPASYFRSLVRREARKAKLLQPRPNEVQSDRMVSA